MDAIREKIIQIAKSELGKTGAQDYWTLACGNVPYSPKIAYCGIFCLWCLKNAGLLSDFYWHFGGGFCLENKLPITHTPQPGDIAIKPVPFNHHMIVESVDWGTRKALVLAANTPNVKEYTVDLIGIDFYSIDSLIAYK